MVKANYLVCNNEYDAAIPQLEIAIKSENNKHQKTRMKYLLGQLYAQLGDKAKQIRRFGNLLRVWIRLIVYIQCTTQTNRTG